MVVNPYSDFWFLIPTWILQETWYVFLSVLHFHTSKFPDFATSMPSMSPDGDTTGNPSRGKSVGVVAIIYDTRGHGRGEL